jgi:formylmethanofuran dehydrogenase subunit E
MDKSLKYRAVCPYCGKSFDMKTEGRNLVGRVVCKECYDAHMHFLTSEDTDFEK